MGLTPISVMHAGNLFMVGCMDQSPSVAVKIKHVKSTGEQHEVSLFIGKGRGEPRLNGVPRACTSRHRGGSARWRGCGVSVTLPLPGSSRGQDRRASRQTNTKAGSSYEMEIKDMINPLFKTIRCPIPAIRPDWRDDEDSG